MDDKKTEQLKSLLSLRSFRDLVVLIFFGVMSFKLFSMELTLNIKEFGFTDLLSMLVAFFAIGLSVAFYFKATDTSNRFYDNSYAFTKDVSEILGRMEAGFGERLRHLDEGYSGIRDRFDKLPFDSAKAMEEIEKENEEIKKKEAEQRKTLEELAQKAHLVESEKLELFEHMERLNRDLEESKDEARRLEKMLHFNEMRHGKDSFKVLEYLARRFSELGSPEMSMKSPISSYRNIFRKIKASMPREAVRDLELHGFLDEDGELTRDAIERLRMIERRIA
jgi:chromosome segregation ATPase